MRADRLVALYVSQGVVVVACGKGGSVRDTALDVVAVDVVVVIVDVVAAEMAA